MCRLSWNLGASTSWNPQGLSRSVMGLLYVYVHSSHLSEDKKDQMISVFEKEDGMRKKKAKKKWYWKADWQVRRSNFFDFQLLLLYVRCNFPLCPLPHLLLVFYTVNFYQIEILADLRSSEMLHSAVWYLPTFRDNLKQKSNPITDLDRPWGFQEVEAPRFQDNRHMKVVRLSA